MRRVRTLSESFAEFAMRLVHVCQQFVCMHASLSPRNAPLFRKFAAQQFARLKLRRLSSWPGKSKSSWRMATLNLREVHEIRIFLERNPVLLDIAMMPCNAEELAAKLLAEAEIGLLGGDLSDTSRDHVAVPRMFENMYAPHQNGISAWESFFHSTSLRCTC